MQAPTQAQNNEEEDEGEYDEEEAGDEEEEEEDDEQSPMKGPNIAVEGAKKGGELSLGSARKKSKF